jgi:hypothetical protein
MNRAPSFLHAIVANVATTHVLVFQQPSSQRMLVDPLDRADDAA